MTNDAPAPSAPAPSPSIIDPTTLGATDDAHRSLGRIVTRYVETSSISRLPTRTVLIDDAVELRKIADQARRLASELLRHA